MRILTALLALLTIIGEFQLAFAQQPMLKGAWSCKGGTPERVVFDYGTVLTSEEIERLSRVSSLTHITMGYAGVDSEYVTMEGDLLKLGRLKKLKALHFCIDGIKDKDLRFVGLLPEIHTLEFNADSGYDGAPICTDRCADHLGSAKTLRRLVLHGGEFTDKFVATITQSLPDLEELMLNSSELSDESLRLIAERCKHLKSLSITSDHFTVAGLKHLDKLKQLEKRRVNSPALRKRRRELDPTPAKL